MDRIISEVIVPFCLLIASDLFSFLALQVFLLSQMPYMHCGVSNSACAIVCRILFLKACASTLFMNHYALLSLLLPCCSRRDSGGVAHTRDYLLNGPGRV